MAPSLRRAAAPKPAPPSPRAGEHGLLAKRRAIQAAVATGVALLVGAAVTSSYPYCVFAAMYTRPVSYSMMVFWMTMMLALLYDFLGTLTQETLFVRIPETVIGAALALQADLTDDTTVDTDDVKSSWLDELAQ